MALFNTENSYGSLARALHWLIAGLVLTNIALALRAEALPRGSDADVAWAATVYSAHKTIGVAVLFLALIRVGLALCQPRPAPLHADRRLETFAAAAVHWSLYAALLVMPLSGWLYHAASAGFAPILWPFGQTLPFVPKSAALADLFKSVHGASSKLLILSVMAHVAGALKHALIDRDATLTRMITGRAAKGSTALHPNRLPALCAALAWAAIIATGIALAPAEKPANTTLQAAAGGNWQVSDGQITFAVRQMGADIQGQLAGWGAEITYDETARQGSVAVSIPLSGLTLGAVTDQAKGPEFFDVAQHPVARFNADITDMGGRLAAVGTLSLRGKDVPVTLPFTLTISGDRADMNGQVTLDRRDFGMGPSYPDETTVAFPVRIDITLAALRTK